MLLTSHPEQIVILSVHYHKAKKSFDPPKLPNINCDEIKELIVKMVKVFYNFIITIDYLSKYLISESFIIGV